MYSIGNEVAYPMHGAGVISKIENREVLGVTKSYYVLQMPYGSMQVLVPVDSADQVGLRPVVSEKEIPAVLKVLSADSTPMDDNWNRRIRENADKLKTGELANVAEVIRNLTRVGRTKKLSSGEKKQLQSAMQILISEMILACKYTEGQARQIIEEAI